jgi:hypothetical protein
MGCLLQVVCFIVADKINSTCWSSHLLKAILDRYDFPSFYDWANNVAPIEENQRLFKEWIEINGREFELKPDE